MKTKKLLFGLIEMNATLYNILYTLLYVVILFTVLYGLAALITHIWKPTDSFLEITLARITSAFIVYILGCKVFDKNNYI